MQGVSAWPFVVYSMAGEHLSPGAVENMKTGVTSVGADTPTRKHNTALWKSS